MIGTDDDDDVNRPTSDRERHSPGQGRLMAQDSVCPQIPVKAPPPTSRSAITHLSRVSLEPTPRAQGDLVRSSEICQVLTPPTRLGQRYIGMNQRKWDCCACLRTSWQLWTHVCILSTCERPAGQWTRCKTSHPELFWECVDVYRTLVCCLREPCEKVQSHMQWPQCSSNRLTRTYQRTRGQSDCKSPSPLLFLHRSVFTDPFSNSLLLTTQFPDTLTPEVQQCSVLSSWLVFDVSVVCTCTVLLHILSGSVWVCNLWSARFWDCNAHDSLKDCVVGQKDFISMCHPWCRTRIHLQLLACTWTFHLCLLILNLIYITVHVADQLNFAKIHIMKSVALWLIQFFSTTTLCHPC